MSEEKMATLIRGSRRILGMMLIWFVVVFGLISFHYLDIPLWVGYILGISQGLGIGMFIVITVSLMHG